MANTGVLRIYIFFIIFFNVIIGLYDFGDNEIGDTEQDFKDFMPLTSMFSKITDKTSGIFNIFDFVLLPLAIIDSIILLMAFLVAGFITAPILNAIIITPFITIITYEYVLPMIRGN